MIEDGFNLSETIEWKEIFDEVDKAAIPERQEKYIKLFHTTQCSRCRKFYTNQPFLCPNKLLQSNCVSFEKLNERRWEAFARDEQWWWRMYDMLVRVQEKGILTKCWNCGALNPNPNPKKRVCWMIEEKGCSPDSLLCPDCHDYYLIYNIDSNTRKCMKQGCHPKNTNRVSRSTPPSRSDRKRL